MIFLVACSEQKHREHTREGEVTWNIWLDDDKPIKRYTIDIESPGPRRSITGYNTRGLTGVRGSGYETGT